MKSLSSLSDSPALAPAATGESSSAYAFPLSYGQQRLWFMQQLAPESTNYNVPIALRFAGELDLPALMASLNEIVRRHEVLRTTFPAPNDEPVQLVSPPAPVLLSTTDLSHVARAEQDDAARGVRLQEAAQPFDLAAGPLLRARLVRLNEQRHELLLTLHHIVSDGWSRGILIDELLALYAAYREGKAIPPSRA